MGSTNTPAMMSIDKKMIVHARCRIPKLLLTKDRVVAAAEAGIW
jgi:hypothetical protein